MDGPLGPQFFPYINHDGAKLDSDLKLETPRKCRTCSVVERNPSARTCNAGYLLIAAGENVSLPVLRIKNNTKKTPRRRLSNQFYKRDTELVCLSYACGAALRRGTATHTKQIGVRKKKNKVRRAISSCHLASPFSSRSLLILLQAEGAPAVAQSECKNTRMKVGESKRPAGLSCSS